MKFTSMCRCGREISLSELENIALERSKIAYRCMLLVVVFKKEDDKQALIAMASNGFKFEMKENDVSRSFLSI